MRNIRSWIYKMGFRPKPGTIFFSPSLNIHYALKALRKKE